MINHQTAKITELKVYCQQKDIQVIGDKRKKQSYIDSINNHTEIQQKEISFDLIDFCYSDFLTNHHNNDHEQLIAVDYYLGMTLQDLHNQVIDQIDYVYSEKIEVISNNVIQYVIASYFSDITVSDFKDCIKSIDQDGYDNDYPTTFYFVLTWFIGEKIPVMA